MHLDRLPKTIFTSSTLNEILKAIRVFCRHHRNIADARKLADVVLQRITDLGVQPDDKSHSLIAQIQAGGVQRFPKREKAYTSEQSS